MKSVENYKKSGIEGYQLNISLWRFTLLYITMGAKLYITMGANGRSAFFLIKSEGRGSRRVAQIKSQIFAEDFLNFEF
jgi:hypothetical protein